MRLPCTKCLHHAACEGGAMYNQDVIKFMQMPKFRNIQTQITQQVSKFSWGTFLCTFQTTIL